MKVHVFYHAFLREKLGRESELLVIADDRWTAGTVIATFVAAHPEFERLSAALNIAVNNEIVGRESGVNEADRIDLLPPYGGG